MNSKMSIADKLLNYGVLINNAITDAAIAEALNAFGYDSAKLAQGKALLEAFDALVKEQIKEYGEQFEATEMMNSAWKSAQKTYMKSLKIARIVFKNNQAAQTALLLNGIRKISFSGWLHQAQTFYQNLEENAEFMTALAEYGYTSEKIADEKALINELETAKHSQAKEKGEAQQATLNRDQKLDVLDEWVSEFKVIAKIALEDNPQWIEKLGLIEKS